MRTWLSDEGLCPHSQLDSQSCLVLLMRSLSTVSRQENVHTMQDDDKRKDDDRKKDSLCELVSLYELDSESCLFLVMRSPSTVSRERSHHAGR